MTIHSEHPFADPEGARDAARRLRGRLSARVGLWTTGADRGRAGLTVSSMLVVGGEPPLVVGMLDPDSALGEALDVGDRVVVHLLQWEHRDLAEQFAGLMPAPGGPFAGATWEQTDAGPRLASAATWALLHGDRHEAARLVAGGGVLAGRHHPGRRRRAAAAPSGALRAARAPVGSRP